MNCNYLPERELLKKKIEKLVQVSLRRFRLRVYSTSGEQQGRQNENILRGDEELAPQLDQNVQFAREGTRLAVSGSA